MSAGFMPKHEQFELPDDISARLDVAIAECMVELRKKVSRMFRFANMEVIPAARIILQENNGPMPINAILEELKAGGIWRPPSGSKGSSADTEILRSLSRSSSSGENLKYVDKEKEIIGLPERD